MPQDDLAARLDAVERRLDAAYPDPDSAEGTADATERIEAFAERLADLEAAVEAVEGYVGEIERVDDELERRADAAIAATDGLEDRLDAIEERLSAMEGGQGSQAAPAAERTGSPQPENDGPARAAERTPPADVQGGAATDRKPANTFDRADSSEPTTCTCDRSGAGAPGAASSAARASKQGTPTGDGRAVPRSDGAASTLDDVGAERQAPPGGDDPEPTPRSIADVGADKPAQPDDPPAQSDDGPTRPAPDRAGQASGARPGAADRQRATLGTDGGQTRDRGTDGAAVSGWGESPEPAAGQRSPDGPPQGNGRQQADGRRQGDGRTDDSGWGDSSGETLLDRLRSML